MINHNEQAKYKADKINQIMKLNNYILIKEFGFNYIFKHLRMN